MISTVKNTVPWVSLRWYHCQTARPPTVGYTHTITCTHTHTVRIHTHTPYNNIWRYPGTSAATVAACVHPELRTLWFQCLKTLGWKTLGLVGFIWHAFTVDRYSNGYFSAHASSTCQTSFRLPVPSSWRTFRVILHPDVARSHSIWSWPVRSEIISPPVKMTIKLSHKITVPSYLFVWTARPTHNIPRLPFSLPQRWAQEMTCSDFLSTVTRAPRVYWYHKQLPQTQVCSLQFSLHARLIGALSSSASCWRLLLHCTEAMLFALNYTHRCFWQCYVL